MRYRAYDAVVERFVQVLVMANKREHIISS